MLLSVKAELLSPSLRATWELPKPAHLKDRERKRHQEQKYVDMYTFGLLFKKAPSETAELHTEGQTQMDLFIRRLKVHIDQSRGYKTHTAACVRIKLKCVIILCF